MAPGLPTRQCQTIWSWPKELVNVLDRTNGGAMYALIITDGNGYCTTHTFEACGTG